MIVYRFAKIVCPPVFKPIYRYKVVNRYDIPKGQGMVLCSNHISLLDPIFVAFSQRRTIRFMAKKEIFTSKLATAFFHSLGGFSIDRSKTDMHAIDTAFRLLEEKQILGIFPEGTRSKDGELLKPKAGAAMIAYKSGCDVMPVAIVAEKKKTKPFRRLIINCGRPMSHEAMGFKEGTGQEFRNATRVIWKEVERLQAEARAMF